MISWRDSHYAFVANYFRAHKICIRVYCALYCCDKVISCRNSGYGLSQSETTLQCNHTHNDPWVIADSHDHYKLPLFCRRPSVALRCEAWINFRIRGGIRGNESIPCSNDVWHIVKCFHNFKIPAIPLIWPKSSYNHSVTRSHRGGKETWIAVGIAISDIPFSLYLTLMASNVRYASIFRRC